MRSLAASWSHALRLGHAGLALRATVEAEAKEAADRALDLAPVRLRRGPAGRLGIALQLLPTAAAEAQEATIAAWDWLEAKGPDR